MSEIFNIEQLKAMACPVIDIPNFDNTGTIKVRVQKPRLMALAAQGKIPNHLMSVAAKMSGFSSGKKDNKENSEPNIAEYAKVAELYCRACLVEPSYEEFQSIMTDDQMDAIFDWALGGVQQMSTFRSEEGNGASDNHGQGVSEASK